MISSVENVCMEKVVLQLDKGDPIQFNGYIFSESSWYDEEEEAIVSQKLFITEKREQVYYIVSGKGRGRTRRAYTISMEGDVCVLSDGTQTLTLPFEMVMLALRSFCKVDAQAMANFDTVEEALRAANC